VIVGFSGSSDGFRVGGDLVGETERDEEGENDSWKDGGGVSSVVGIGKEIALGAFVGYFLNDGNVDFVNDGANVERTTVGWSVDGSSVERFPFVGYGVGT